MSTSCRRYEILLPRRFNDGRRVPNRLVTESLFELRERFGAASCETQAIRGQWQDQGETYYDELVRVFVDVDDTPDSRQFFLEFKERAKATFRQIEIWMITYPIEVL